MRKKLFSTFFLLCIYQCIQAQVNDTVFRDFNANGTKDTTTTFNEPFVEGVTDKAKIEPTIDVRGIGRPRPEQGIINYITAAGSFVDVPMHTRLHYDNLWDGVDAHFCENREPKI